MQEVIAAITTSPWPRSKFLPSTLKRFSMPLVFLNSVCMAEANPGFGAVERHAILRPLRPGDRGRNFVESSESVSLNTGSGVDFVRNMPCARA